MTNYFVCCYEQIGGYLGRILVLSCCRPLIRPSCFPWNLLRHAGVIFFLVISWFRYSLFHLLHQCCLGGRIFCYTDETRLNSYQFMVVDNSSYANDVFPTTKIPNNSYLSTYEVSQQESFKICVILCATLDQPRVVTHICEHECV